MYSNMYDLFYLDVYELNEQKGSDIFLNKTYFFLFIFFLWKTIWSAVFISCESISFRWRKKKKHQMFIFVVKCWIRNCVLSVFNVKLVFIWIRSIPKPWLWSFVQKNTGNTMALANYIAEDLRNKKLIYTIFDISKTSNILSQT